jgi:hypothetical protein
LIISVSTDDVPMALAQPKVLNFASAILPSSSSLKVSFRASPQAREPTSPIRIFHFPDVPRIEKMVLKFIRVFPHD